MPYKSTEHLIQLINSLTAAEKRSFRMAMNSSNQKAGSLYMSLFDYLDKYNTYDEKKILQRIPSIKKGQLSNLKSNLYKQLLSSLRALHRNNDTSITLRENLDYAVVLHNKGLYNASLVLLEKVKKLAMDNQQYSTMLSALELEKKIEGLYVTGSMYPKAKQLTNETNTLIDSLTINHKLSNLSLSLYGLYLQRGFVKDNEGYDFITDYFRIEMPRVRLADLDFYGQLYYFQSHVWYFFMVQDFPNYYRYSVKWLALFDNNPKWKDIELTIYLKGFHNVLNAAFMTQRYDKFKPILKDLLALGKAQFKKMTTNQQSNFVLIKSIHEINEFFLTGRYADGIAYVQTYEDILLGNKWGWDLNRQLAAYFKVGCLYFCVDDFDNALLCMNKITNHVYPDFREDLQCFARILSLIIHFEQGNEMLISHQVKSTYRYIAKIEHLQIALRDILRFLRKLSHTTEHNLNEEFVKLKNSLENIEGEDFERRPFLYLDIISWLESKIEGLSMQQVLQRKMTQNGKIL